MTRRHQLILLVVAVVAAALLVREGAISPGTAYLLGALVPSVILHEVAHGALAFAYGDDTAKRAGRLSLNPVAHVDPFGTLVLPAMLAIATAGATTFGYAKPVPVNPRRLRDPRNQSLWVSLAGPGVNIVLAVIAAVGFGAVGGSVIRMKLEMATGPELFFYGLGVVNVLLAVFNLIPVPPLDGSAMVERFLPYRWWEPYLRLRQYGFAIVLLLVFVVGLDRLFDPAVALWQRLLPAI